MSEKWTTLACMLMIPWFIATGQDTISLKKAASAVDPIDSLIRSRETTLTVTPPVEACGHVTASDWNNQTPYIRFSGRESSFESSQSWMENREAFQTPVPGIYVRGFGSGHTGIDVALHMGDSVRASWTGVVRYAGYDNGGYGKLVVVRHCNGLETWYAHLSAILVQPNQTVGKGKTIGLGGSTGRSTGPHLHFETRYMGKPMDPLRVIRINKGVYDFKGSILPSSDASSSR